MTDEHALARPGRPAPTAATITVVDPSGHDEASIEGLRAAATGGATVVVVDPPATAAWADLVGADIRTFEDHAEVVLEPTDADAARNLAVTVLPGGTTTFEPRGDTEALLTQNLRFTTVAAATRRTLGEGQVLALGREPGMADVLDPDPVRLVHDRVLRRVGRPSRPRPTDRGDRERPTTSRAIMRGGGPEPGVFNTTRIAKRSQT